MATTTTNLAAVSVPAESRLYPQAQKVTQMTETNSALDATVTPGAGQCVRLFMAELSFSAAPSAVKVFTIEDGSTVIWQREISVSAPFVHVFDFSKVPLRGSAGAVLHGKVAASGAAVQTIMLLTDIVQVS